MTQTDTQSETDDRPRTRSEDDVVAAGEASGTVAGGAPPTQAGADGGGGRDGVIGGGVRGDDRGGRDLAPTLGPLGGLRWLWTQLTSMRTALVLLFALAVAAVPGSLIPQRDVSPIRVSDFITQHPTLGPIYDKVGLFNVFTLGLVLRDLFAAVRLPGRLHRPPGDGLRRPSGRRRRGRRGTCPGCPRTRRRRHRSTRPTRSCWS